jgi:uncharacterized protein (DUF1778 family)
VTDPARKPLARIPESRDARIIFRVTPSQREELEAAARAAGFDDLSTFVRECVATGKSFLEYQRQRKATPA